MVTFAFDAIGLLVGIASTVWVARSLRTSRGGSAGLPLLGFQLLALGGVAIATAVGAPPDDLQQAIQQLCGRIGLELLLLGALHRAILGVAP